MIYFETTHKRLSIHVFIEYVAQTKIDKCQWLKSFYGWCALWKLTSLSSTKKLLLLVGFRCHKEGKIGMTHFKTTHKRFLIHVFLTSVSQAKHGKCQQLKSFSGWCTLWKLPWFTFMKNYYCLLVADVTKKGKEEWCLLKPHTKGFLLMCL